MDKTIETTIKNAIHSMAKGTLRTLCLAYKKVVNLSENLESN